jgi:multimeric flavodoxin WrbA
MRVLAFSTSPRISGNSETLLDRVIDGLGEAGAVVRKLRTCELNLSPCTGCNGCGRDGVCMIGDDFLWLADELRGCDGVVFASPLYFMNVPAGGKALIDRLQAFWVARHRLGIDLFGGRERFGLLVSCAGSSRGPGGADIFRGIEDTMHYAFDALGLRKVESLLVRGADAPGAVAGMPDVMDRARRIGRELGWR